MKNTRLRRLILTAPLLTLLVAGAPSQKPNGRAPRRIDILDLEDYPPGTMLDEVFGLAGAGPVLVSAFNPNFAPGVNAALSFGSGQPTGGDFDLGTPNEDFGGPGVGDGGAAGSPFANDRFLGNVLIVGDNLQDSNGDGLVDDPGDTGSVGSSLRFDFTPLGKVVVYAITIVDVEFDTPPGMIELFDRKGNLMKTLPLPRTGDNGVAVVSLRGTTGVGSMVVTLNGSGAVDDLIFSPPEHISGIMWEDINGNGIQDDDGGGGDQPPLGGVRLVLFDAMGGVVATTDTKMDGSYQFPAVDPGVYTLDLIPSSLPSGFIPSPCNAGDDDTKDSDCLPLDFVVGPTELSDLDFGFFDPFHSGVGDFVWDDVNANGIQDLDELGLVGVRVFISDEMGTVIASDTTDENGFYGFMGLAPGTYVLDIDEGTLPAKFGPSLCNAGDDRTIDSDCLPATITLALFEVRSDVDFGFNETCDGLIGDLIFEDLNDNDMQDPLDIGIQGVTIILLDEFFNPVATVLSDKDGHYKFQGLCAGVVYHVDRKLPGNFGGNTVAVELGPLICDQGNDDTDSECAPACVVLGNKVNTTVEQNNSIDFGFEACDACIGGVDALSLRYLGSVGTQIEVEQTDDKQIVFSGFVEPEGVISFNGAKADGTLGKEIKIRVDCDDDDDLDDDDDDCDTKIHTSCSKPIFLGLTVGDFEVVAGSSRLGGAFCEQ